MNFFHLILPCADTFFRLRQPHPPPPPISFPMVRPLDWTCSSYALPSLSYSFFADEMDLVDQRNQSLSEENYANQPMADTGSLNNDGSSDPDNHEECT